MKTSCYLVTFLASALSGCGGDETSPSPSDVATYASLETATTAVTSELLSIVPNSNGALTITSGELVGASGQVVLGNRTGVLDPGTGEIAFEDGSILQLQDAQSEFVRIHNFENFGADAGFGVIGVRTQANDLPTGEQTYSLQGGGVVAVNEGTTFYSLRGDVSLVANMRGVDNTLTMEIDQLDGQKFTRDGEITQVFDVLDLTISNATISNGTFSGGDLQFGVNETSGGLSALSGAETLFFEGGFFGPEGTEVGGAFSIDDTNDGGNMIVTGAFVALQ